MGKLIANAAKLPIVVPIYHTGIQETMPQNRENQLIHFAPQFLESALITIQPGDPVPVQDLIDAYHAGARARAVARNQRRIEAVRAEMQRAGVPAAAINEQLAPLEAQQRRWAAAVGGAGAAGSGAASGSDSGVFGWLWRLFGAGSSSSGPAAGSAAPATPPPLRGAAAGKRPAVADPALVPFNTVDEASDHTGASARVAGISKPLSAAEAAAAAAAQLGPHQQQHEAMRRSVAELETAAANTAAAAAVAARETAVELEARIAATAREIESQASELAARLRSLRAQKEADDAAAAIAKDAKAAAAAAKEARAAADASAPHSSAAAVAAAAAAAEELPARIGAVMHDVAEEASAVMHDVAAEAKTVMHDVAEAVEQATSRFRSSISVPAPPSHPMPLFPRRASTPAPAAAAAAAPALTAAAPVDASVAAALAGEAASPDAASTSTGPRRVRAVQLGAALQIADESAAAAAASGSAAQPAATASELLSRAAAASSSSPSGAASAATPLLPDLSDDDPVLEIIPTRTLRTGAVVPQFVEAPLRIKPPDHRFLTPSEAAEEEDFRLQLYSDIASRLEAALVVLERQVIARRHAQGHVESRPMETPSLRYGPPHAPPTLPGLPREGEEEDASVSAQMQAIAVGDGGSRAIAAAALGTSAGSGASSASKVDASPSPVAQAIRRMFGGSKHAEVAAAPAPVPAAAAAAAGAATTAVSASNAASMR